MSAFSPLSWRPRRRGKTYCSSACGRGCTHAEYLLAKQKAAQLCQQLGKGWRPVVHENMGWWYHASWRGGHLHVWPGFTAYLNPNPKSEGGRWVATAGSPRRAVRMVLEKAEAEVRQINTMLNAVAGNGCYRGK